MKKKKVKTEELLYPCPKCGTYYLPYMHDVKGFAFMLCKKCNTQYKTCTAVSANFRKFCSKIGSKPNRSPTYYSSAERKVRRFLIGRGLLEGLDFFHNARIGPFINDKKRKVYYWCDFVVPSKKLIIEASPDIWHKMWNRLEADKRKTEYLNNLGWDVLHLNEKNLRQLNKRRKKSKYPKKDDVKRLYKIFGCLEKYEIDKKKKTTTK